jgi:hypothetical protein
MNFVRHNEQGRIMETGVMGEDGIAHLTELHGYTYVEGEGDPSLHYVLDGAVVARPAFDLEDETVEVGDVLELALPVDPCTVIHKGVLHTATGGVLQLTAETIGSFDLSFRAFPYLDKTITVTVNAAA